MKRRLVFILTALSVFLSLPDSSEAVPSFARQTGYSCNTCHTIPPRLNRFGNLFKLRGYTDGTAIPSFEAGEGKQLSQFNPVSFRLLAFPYSKEEESDAEVLFPEALSIYFAGKVSDNVGTFVSIMEREEMPVEFDAAKIAVVNDYGNALLGLMFGVDSPIGMNPSNILDKMRDITRQGSSPNMGVKNNGLLNIFDTANRGAVAYALFNDLLYVNTGAFTGLSQDMMGESINKEGGDPLDFYGSISLMPSTSLGDLNIGMFYYTGKEEFKEGEVKNISDMMEPDFERNRTSRLGFNVEGQKAFGDAMAELLGLYIIGRDELKDTAGNTPNVDQRGYQLWGTMYYKSKYALSLGYGWYKYDDANPIGFVEDGMAEAAGPEQTDERRDATIHLSYMFRPNVRVGAEYTDTNWDKSEDTSLTSLMFDLLF